MLWVLKAVCRRRRRLGRLGLATVLRTAGIQSTLLHVPDALLRLKRCSVLVQYGGGAAELVLVEQHLLDGLQPNGTAVQGSFGCRCRGNKSPCGHSQRIPSRVSLQNGIFEFAGVQALSEGVCCRAKHLPLQCVSHGSLHRINIGVAVKSQQPTLRLHTSTDAKNGATAASSAVLTVRISSARRVRSARDEMAWLANSREICSISKLCQFTTAIGLQKRLQWYPQYSRM